MLFFIFIPKITTAITVALIAIITKLFSPVVANFLFETVLSFLLSLISVPVIVIGTSKSLVLFSDIFTLINNFVVCQWFFCSCVAFYVKLCYNIFYHS